MAPKNTHTPPIYWRSFTFCIMIGNKVKHISPSNIKRACSNRIRFTLYLSAPGLFRGLTKRSPLPMRMMIPTTINTTAAIIGNTNSISNIISTNYDLFAQVRSRICKAPVITRKTATNIHTILSALGAVITK